MLFEGDIRKTIYLDALNIELGKLCITNNQFSHDGWWMESPSNSDLSKYGAFRFKLFSKTLPTHHRMIKKFPGLFQELMCPGCGLEKETDEHVFLDCTTYKGIKWDAWERISIVLSEATSANMREVTKEAPNWICPTTNKCTNSLNLWFLAGVPSSVEEWLSLYIKKKKRIEVWKRIHSIAISTAHDIWKIRCDRNCTRGWTLHNLQVDFLEDAISWENNYLMINPQDAPPDFHNIEHE